MTDRKKQDCADDLTSNEASRESRASFYAHGGISPGAPGSTGDSPARTEVDAWVAEITRRAEQDIARIRADAKRRRREIRRGGSAKRTGRVRVRTNRGSFEATGDTKPIMWGIAFAIAALGVGAGVGAGVRIANGNRSRD